MHSQEALGLPVGWEWCTIGEIAVFLDNVRIPVSAKERKKRIAGKTASSLFPYYGANGQVGWIDDYIFNEELVLLAEDGGYFRDRSKPIAYRIRGKSWVNNHAHVLRPKQGIELGYLHWVLNYCDVMPFVHGTTRLKLNQSDARRIRIPLPPSSEQKRIVAKIETLFAESKTARGALEEVLPLLGSFRQSVLAKAFKGELTERDPNDEPAQKLLERIRQERLEADHTRGLGKNKGQLYIRLPELPKTWIWTRISELETFIGSGMTPRGGKEVYVDEGIPFIRSQNVHSDGLHLEDIAHITLQKHAAMKRTQIRPNDVLLNITGASIGRSTYIPEGFSEANVNQHVCIIRTGWWMVPAYLSYFLNSPYGQDQIYATQSGVTREALNYTQVRSLQVPLAPLREQQRLVAKIEEFFSLAYKAEAAVKKAREKVQKIEQSVLAKAFRGELVPQDPSDEPASILLQRIKVDTEKMQIRARKRKRKIRPPTKVQQTRTKPPRSIRAFLKEMGQATVEQAFHASGLSMSDFWDELKKEIDAGRIEQIRKGSSVFLKVKS